MGALTPSCGSRMSCRWEGMKVLCISYSRRYFSSLGVLEPLPEGFPVPGFTWRRRWMKVLCIYNDRKYFSSLGVLEPLLEGGFSCLFHYLLEKEVDEGPLSLRWKIFLFAWSDGTITWRHLRFLGSLSLGDEGGWRSFASTMEEDTHLRLECWSYCITWRRLQFWVQYFLEKKEEESPLHPQWQVFLSAWNVRAITLKLP